MPQIKFKFARLNTMMFLQYMLFAVWWIPFAAYLANMNITGLQNAMLLSTMAIGSLASPLIGMLADRYFHANKTLVVLNLINGGLLLFAGTITNHTLLLVVLMISMLCYMPTWALTNSIAMVNIPSGKFPYVRVFGSIGWVASGIFSIISVKVFNIDFDGTNMPFFYAGVLTLLAGLTNLTLPATPPLAKGQKGSLIDAFGLRTLKYLSDRNFAIFTIFSLLSVIPFSMYWSFGSEFLQDRGFKFITVTMNWGQLAEMLILLTIPFLLKRIGLKKVMIVGLAALVVRYLAFYFGVVSSFTSVYIIGILVQGVIFGYFYVGGQMYVDNKMPAALKSQGQGFIFLITWGVGLLISNFISRKIIDFYSWTDNGIKEYNWTAIWGITIAMTVLLLLAFTVLFKDSNQTETEFDE